MNNSENTASKRGLKGYILVSLKGMGMGAADVVPGVSGGTIAFISGIYEELVNSIKSINYNSIKKIWKEGIPSFWKSINGTFLMSVVIGIMISVLSLARLLEYLLINHPILIWSFFIGLVIASAVFVALEIKKWNIQVIVAMMAGIAAGYIITALSPTETTNAYWFIFLSGAIAICAMILPGISGSFILLLLGKYQFILSAVNQVRIGVLSIFLVGCLIGIISFSNLLSWLLKRFHDITISVLAGFMIGSLNKIWPWKITLTTFTDSHGAIQPLTQQNVLPGKFLEMTQQNPQIFAAFLLAVSGALLILVFQGLSRLKKT